MMGIEQAHELGRQDRCHGLLVLACQPPEMYPEGVLAELVAALAGGAGDGVTGRFGRLAELVRRPVPVAAEPAAVAAYVVAVGRLLADLVPPRYSWPPDGIRVDGGDPSNVRVIPAGGTAEVPR